MESASDGEKSQCRCQNADTGLSIEPEMIWKGNKIHTAVRGSEANKDTQTRRKEMLKIHLTEIKKGSQMKEETGTSSRRG
jgi:hypothetical protein